MSSSELEDIIEDGPEPDPTPEDADTAPDADASEPAVDVEAPPKKRVKPLRLKAAVVLPLLFGVSSLGVPGSTGAREPADVWAGSVST